MRDLSVSYARLLEAAEARRRHMPLRVITALPIALVVYLITEFSSVWVWMGVHIAAQVLEVWAIRPARAEWRKPSWGRMIFIVALFVLPALILSGICGALWLLGGSYGPALAVFLISGSVINLIVISAQSRIAFLTSSAPYLLTAALVVIFDPDVTPFYRPVTILACLLMLSSSLVTWRMFERAITAQKDALNEAEARRLEVEAALRAKAGYIATVSQELKSPINAILAAAAQLQGTHPPAAEVRGLGQRIARSGSTMRGLLNDLADFARLESGGMLVEHIPFDLRRKGHDVLRAWRPAARRKGLRLKLEGAATLPRWVNGDPMRISQALNALFATAIRNAEGGSVTIRLSAKSGDDGRIGITVVLIDTGPAPSTEELEALFSPFDRASPRVGGSGLGLAISRELARLMGGDLTAVAGAEEGAVFTLSFRVYPIDAPEPQDILTAVIGARVLVAAPSALHRAAMELLLPLGLRPAVAESGETALAMLDRQAFDIVLMGTGLPGLNGFEVTRRLRTSPSGNRAIPVVGLVPSAAPRDWDGCRRAGMNSWVAAPIDGAELYAAMAEALVTRRRARETAPA
ncbi:ATP-binding protein [Caulobacter segnis]|uniref:ATP-binding response regulator n=1 Tax=Caulobacter segnis TaxID=88688 RepID=UPI00240EBF6E|nr:ATP-binding protein [Caulobacter segnis]MDG2521655.1 ATP-binding protein [Caulobacter segnis]